MLGGWRRWAVLGVLGSAPAVGLVALTLALVRSGFETGNRALWAEALESYAPSYASRSIPGSRWVGTVKGSTLVLTEYGPGGSVREHEVDLELPRTWKLEQMGVNVLPLPDGALAFTASVSSQVGIRDFARVAYGRVGVRTPDGRSWVRQIPAQVTSFVAREDGTLEVFAQFFPYPADLREFPENQESSLETWQYRFRPNGEIVTRRSVCVDCMLTAPHSSGSAALQAWAVRFEDGNLANRRHELSEISVADPMRSLVKLSFGANASIWPIARAPDGRIAAIGTFENTWQAGPHARVLSSRGGKDVFVAMFSPRGELEFVRQHGGADDEHGCAASFADDGSLIALWIRHHDAEPNWTRKLLRGRAAAYDLLELVRLDRKGKVVASRRLPIGENRYSHPFISDPRRLRLLLLDQNRVAIFGPRQTLAPIFPEPVAAEASAAVVGFDLAQ